VSENLFDFVAQQLEQSTSLDRLASRGTLRLALKRAGLEPDTASQSQYCVVAERVLPDELDSRGVEGAPAICAALVETIQNASPDRWGTTTDVDGIFDRLAGS